MPMFNNDVLIWKTANTDTEKPSEERIKDLREEMETYVETHKLPETAYPELTHKRDFSVMEMRIYERIGPDIIGNLCDQKKE